MDHRSDGPLVEALAECGVDAALVEMEWDDLCQEEVLTFSGARFSHGTLARLADLYLTFPSRFVFPSDDLQNAFNRIVQNAPAMMKAKEDGDRKRLQMLKVRGLANFKCFDPNQESLTAFAARTEAACGFDSGEMLSVINDNSVRVVPRHPSKLQFDPFSTLLSLLAEAAPDVQVSVVGQTVN